MNLSGAASAEFEAGRPGSPDPERWLAEARRVAGLTGADAVDVEHLRIAAARIAGTLDAALLESLRVPDEARAAILAPEPLPSAAADSLARAVDQARQERREDEGVEFGRLPARELTRGAVTEELFQGRERELARLDALLDREERTSIFLLGPRGSGRRSLVRAWARRLRDLAAPGEPRRQVYLFEPALARKAAPPIFEGEGAVVGAWLAELLGRAGTGVFAFTEFIADEWVYDDFLEFVVPAALRRWATCAFLVTPEERRELSRRHPALNGVAVDVVLEPLDAATTRALLAARARRWPAAEGLSIADTAVEAAVNLAGRHLANVAFPGSAIEVLERTRERVRAEFAPRLEEQERAIDAVQKSIREAVAAGDLAGASRHRVDRDRLLKEYDARLERAISPGAGIVIGTGEVVKTVAALTGKAEAELAGGAWA